MVADHADPDALYDAEAIDILGAPPVSSPADPIRLADVTPPERHYPPKSARNRKALAFKAKGERRQQKHQRGQGWR